MSNPIREDFKEIIKNNEYNNISIRVIKTGKYEDTKSIISYNQIPKQTFPQNIINNYSSKTTPIMKKNSQTSFNNPQDNKKLKVLDFKNNQIINKITTSNLRKFGKKLIGLKHFESSNDFEKNIQKDHHAIYISKNFDSSKNNIIESNNINNNISQITSKNKLYTNLVKRPNILNNIQSHPKGKNFSNLYSINIQNIDNKNIITNPGFDTNTYRNSNFQQTNFQNYNILTFNPKKESNDKIPRNKRKENKIYYNNTLTLINEIKKGSVISHRLNRKDLENIKNSKNVPSNKYSREDNSFYNPAKNKSFISEIPKASFSRYDSRDKIIGRIVPKINIDISKIKYVRENQSFKNIIRVSSSSRKNIQVNTDISSSNNNINAITYTQPSNTNHKYTESHEINKNKKDLFKNFISQKYINTQEIKDSKDKLRSLLYKHNIKDIMNKSMDNKDIQRPRFNRTVNSLNCNIHTIKDFSQKKVKKEENDAYMNERIKEEEKEDSFNKNDEEDSKNDNNSGNKKYILLDNNGIIINKKLNNDKNRKIIPHYNSKNFNNKKDKKEEPLNPIKKLNKRKKQKNLLKLQKAPKKEIKEVKEIKKEEIKDNNINNYNNTNVYYTINSEEKIPQESEVQKTLNSLEDKDSKTLSKEKIKSVIMGANYNMLKKKARISLTTKKDLTKIFNTETSDTNTINEINTKHINYKGVKYRLVSSLSVKDQLRKYISDRKKNLDKSITKYQYNEEDDKSISHLTHTAKREKTINNYTYLELKDIKNIKRDTFITLHSIGGVKDDSRFEDFEPSSTVINLKEKEFKPFVSTHPGKKFKKRGLHKFRLKSERRIRGIKIVGNSDTIEYYQNDKLNFSAIKKSKFFGNSSKNIFFGSKREKEKDKVIEENNE